MKIIRSREFTEDRPWAAIDIANMNGTTSRLHWTDQPYKWHTNDGEKIATWETGDVFFAGVGCEHVAHPVGVARILVVEREGSV